MNLQQQQNTLRKYLQGEATVQEKEWVEKWYDSFDHLAPAELPIPPEEGEVMQAAILKQIRRGSVIPLWQTISKVAAVFLVMALGSWYYFQKSNEEATLYSYITSGKDQSIQVMLPDSSLLWLNKNTTIKYARRGFGQSARTLWLEAGEAYFQVKPDKEVPFLVHTGNLTTRVVGTAFNIKKSQQLQEVQVSVTHGKVQVASPGGSLGFLIKGRQLNYHAATGKHTVSRIQPAYATAWQQESLDLTDASFAEMSTAFYSLYDTRLIAGNKEIENHSYSLTLGKGLSAAEALAIIKTIHQLNHRKENGKIILY